MTHAHHSAAPAHAAFSLTGLHCLDCADAVERALKANPHITSVHIDWPNSVAHVSYHGDMIDEAAIRRIIEPVMITGDNTRTAEAVARELGIERFFAEVLPADKAGHVKALQAEGKRVAMVGDGVNDAPALAQADTGIAIGAGTDVAIETADVVLMKSDPLDILNAITVSKATVRKMKQNLFWAAIYNVLAIPVAAGVLYPSLGLELRPEWAALLMSASSIIVAVNAVLLRGGERELRGSSQPQPATGGRAAPAT